MKYKILCTDGLSEVAIDKLKKLDLFEVVYEKSITHEDLLKKIPDFHGLIVRSASTVSKDIIEAGKNLKIVVRAGVGTDNIDANAASEKGISVSNTPDGNTRSTAELTFGMLLALSRHIPQAACLMSQGVWEKKKFSGTEVANKTLGLIGVGRVGREVAKRAIAFNIKVLGSDPFLTAEKFNEIGVKQSSLEDIYKNSDYISIHTPLTHETKNLITSRELSTMKKTVRIINCARGGIINEEDLAVALKNGTIAGAAIDVFTKEPYDKDIFRGLENIIMTPHLGASTKEAQDAVAIEAAEKIIQFFS